MNFPIKFSFGQLTANSNGKTSASGTAGIFIVLIGGLGFLLGCADKIWFKGGLDIINQAIVFTTLGVALLGYKKSQAIKTEENGEDKNMV